MENRSCQASERMLLQHLGNLRKMMVRHHELVNLAQFVLHDLCTGPCFQVNKAAYFVNNGDFNILRGITGYDQQESYAQIHDAWNDQHNFIAAIQDSHFNQKVRHHTEHAAFEQGKASEKYMVEKIADQLEIANPAYHVWDLKHANHGLLIYEPMAYDVQHEQDHIFDSLYYLSFCPIY